MAFLHLGLPLTFLFLDQKWEMESTMYLMAGCDFSRASSQRLKLCVSTWGQAHSDLSLLLLFFNDWSLFGTHFFSTQHGLGALFLILGTQETKLVVILPSPGSGLPL